MHSTAAPQIRSNVIRITKQQQYSGVETINCHQRVGLYRAIAE